RPAVHHGRARRRRPIGARRDPDRRGHIRDRRRGRGRAAAADPGAHPLVGPRELLVRRRPAVSTLLGATAVGDRADALRRPRPEGIHLLGERRLRRLLGDLLLPRYSRIAGDRGVPVVRTGQPVRGLLYGGGPALAAAGGRRPVLSSRAVLSVRAGLLT